MSAVAALPDFDLALFKYLSGLNVFQKCAVTLFMFFFDRGNKAEFRGKFFEAFLFGSLRKTVIHIRPLIVFAFRCGGEVLSGVSDAVKFLEPHLCVLFFVVGCLQEKRRDLLVALFLCFGRKIGILVPCLRLSGKSRFKIFFRFCSRIFVRHIDYLLSFVLFFFIVEHTVAVAFKIRVCDLLSEFFAHTLVVRIFSDAARTVAVFRLQTVLDGFDDIFVGIESDIHFPPSVFSNRDRKERSCSVCVFRSYR